MYFTNPSNNKTISGKGYSVVNDIRFPQDLSNIANYCRQNNLSKWEEIKLKLKARLIYFVVAIKCELAICFKRPIYIGPFVGEFGNFLGHVLPLIGYFHKRGAQVHFCGLELFRPFCIDEKGNEIVIYYGLRDIYSETTMSTNFGNIPQNLLQEVDSFYERAKQKGILLDLRNEFFYWFVFREFTSKGRAFIYDVKKNFLQTTFYEERSCVLFPRYKGAAETANNGMEWDYDLVINCLAKSFDKIYVLGHPAFVKDVKPNPKVEVKFSTENTDLLKLCANAKCIVSQHSGVIYLSNLLQIPFVLLYKGGSSPSDIGSLNNTLFYLNSVKKSYQIEFCYELNNLNPIIASILKDKYEKTGY